ncbi:MAG: XisI protein [Thiothrix sp.]|nr:MAG: XisI protein [Thiothrix sp.]
MEKLATYRRYIRQLLKTYAELPTNDEQVKRELLFDTEHDRYQLMIIGWRGHERFHGSIIHVDIIGDQIWVQYDGTETGIANELVAFGVPKDDIVLAFHAPYKRKYTGFGSSIEDSQQAA